MKYLPRLGSRPCASTEEDNITFSSHRLIPSSSRSLEARAGADEEGEEEQEEEEEENGGGAGAAVCWAEVPPSVVFPTGEARAEGQPPSLQAARGGAGGEPEHQRAAGEGEGAAQGAVRAGLRPLPHRPHGGRLLLRRRLPQRPRKVRLRFRSRHQGLSSSLP